MSTLTTCPACDGQPNHEVFACVDREDGSATNGVRIETDDDILRSAASILAARAIHAATAKATETTRLYKAYARNRDKLPHSLGKPQKLTQEEALLLVALERNKFAVEGDCPNKSRWHGTAECRYHVRGVAISMMTESRHDLLVALWAAVSDQESTEGILLTEDHLRGSIVQRDIRALNEEIRQQIAAAPEPAQ